MILAGVNLELHNELFERPVVLLGNRLSRGCEVSLREEKTSEPEAGLSEVRLARKFLELDDSLDEIRHPGCG